jgi:hypothetical protein
MFQKQNNERSQYSSNVPTCTNNHNNTMKINFVLPLPVQTNTLHHHQLSSNDDFNEITPPATDEKIQVPYL